MKALSWSVLMMRGPGSSTHGACVAQFSPKRAIAKSYGMAVALKGNVAVVTQDHAFVGDVDDAGMAFLFDRSGKPIAEMQAPTPEKGSVFGVCAATDGNVIAIGAPYASSGGATKAGAVYLYSASDGAWLRTLSAPAPVQGGYFGLSVAIDGGRIVAGAPGTAASGVSGAGICFLFDSAGRSIGELVDPEPTPYGNFGWAVSMRGKLLLVGAKAAKVGNQDGAGKAILFEILGD